MSARLAPIVSTAWRAAVVLLTIQIAVVSILRFVTGGMEPPQVITENAFATPFLLIHVVAGVAALLVGPLQFAAPIRARWPQVHRMTGRIYVAACLIGGPAGFMLALGTTSGPIASVGFAIPAVLWPIFTWYGLRSAMQGRFDEHREWMLRSYALTATAITLRLMLPASAMLGFDFFPAYRAISWLGWMTNLALFEYLIRRERGARMSQPALATA